MKSKAHLPQDILTEILSRLPVKPLLRFKAVCKSWNALISSTHFAKCQLEHTYRSQCHNKSVLYTTRDRFIVLRYEDIENVIMDGRRFQCLHFHKRVKFDGCHLYVDLVGSCNGLVCFTYSKSVDENYSFHVLNPATGDDEVKGFGFAAKDFKDVFFGFGYVASTDDYKIVVVGVFRDSITVYVYSMRLRGDWTELKMGLNELNLSPNWFWPGVLLNETLHWVTADRNIVGFDLVDEKFKIELQMPPVLKGMPLSSKCTRFGLIVTKGCLCACGQLENGLVEVWMMGNYGVEDSWTKLFDCNIESEFYDSFEQILDVAGSKLTMRTDNDSLVVTDYTYPWEKFVHVGHCFDAVKYVESLILPLSMSSEEEKNNLQIA